MIGTTYYQMKQYEKARLAFETTLQLQTDPSAPYVSMIQRNLALWENDSEHLPILEAMLSNSTDTDRLSDYDVETIRKVNNSDPEVAKTHNHLGAIHASMGNLDKAIDHFQQSQRIWPGNVDATNNLQVLMDMKSRNPATPPSQFAK